MRSVPPASAGGFISQSASCGLDPPANAGGTDSIVTVAPSFHDDGQPEAIAEHQLGEQRSAFRKQYLPSPLFRLPLTLAQPFSP